MSPRIGLDLHTLLQAATEMADMDGLDQVTLASLAKKLNIRSPSLYNHVDGLQGLRKKLALHGLEQLHSSMTQAVMGWSGDEAVHALAEAYVTFARRHPGLYEAMLLTFKPQETEIQRAEKEIVNLTIRVLQAYGLEDEPALHATRGLRSILHGFASLEQRGGFELPLDVDVSIRFVIDTFLAGVHTLKQNPNRDQQ